MKNKLLFIIIFFGLLLPEYLSPFVIIGSFIYLFVIKKEKILISKIDYIEYSIFGIMLLSIIWSHNRIFSLAMLMLWIILYFTQLLIKSLCNNKENLLLGFKYLTITSTVASIIGILQVTTNYLSKLLSINIRIFNPLYRYMDEFIYSILPCNIKMKYFLSRSSSVFSNPNIFAYLLALSFPIALYLFYKSSNNKDKKNNALMFVLILLGLLSTKTRVAMISVVISLVVFIFNLNKTEKKQYIKYIFIIILITIPVFLSRYNSNNVVDKSSMTHINIWLACIDYIRNNIVVLFIGIGNGVEGVGYILQNIYSISHPHAHSIIMELIMELGITGLLPFIYLIVNLFKIKYDNDKVLNSVFILFIIAFLILNAVDYLLFCPSTLIITYIFMGFLQHKKKSD